MPRESNQPIEVIFEHVTLGNAVKVSAIHTKSGTEISMMGPANLDRKSLETLALRKLVYVMSRK